MINDIRVVKDRHGSIKLTEDQITDILHGPGTQRDKAARNGCSQPLISYVMNHKWRYARW